MQSLGISSVGEILKGNSTMTDQIKNDSNFSQPICPPQMTNSLSNYQTKKTNNDSEKKRR